MAVTVLRPRADRPDIQVAIVAIDLTRAQLHMVAGSEEPPILTGTVSYRPAAIPLELQQSGHLLAAFNGGFKAIHGQDGMMANGEVYAPAMPDRATVAVRADGTVLLGLWGRDFGSESDLIAWRQNGRLLVDSGEVTERARQGGLGWARPLICKPKPGARGSG